MCPQRDGIEVALQQNHRRKLIDGRFALPVGHACAADGSFSLPAGPALIAKLDGQAGLTLQFTGKLARVIALPAGIAAHVQRVSQQEEGDAARDSQAAQNFNVGSTALALQCIETLRGDAQFVADGQTDPLFAQIQSQNTLQSAHYTSLYEEGVLVSKSVTGTGGERSAQVSAAASGRALQVIATGTILAILYWAQIVFITAILAVIIALILEPFVSLLGKLRLPRSVATFVVCVVALLMLYLAGLAAWNQVSTIASDVPALRQNLTALIEGVSDRIQHMEDKADRLLNAARRTQVAAAPTGVPTAGALSKKSRKTAPPTVLPGPPAPAFIPEVRIHEDNPISGLIYARLGTLYQYVVMASFIPLLVFFMLSWRDHIYHSFLRFFEGPSRLTAARSVQGIATMARAFLVGNFLIGLLLAALSCTFFAIIRLPYPFLIGVLSGLLSLVPCAGIALALLPPLLAALATGAPSAVIVFALAFVIGLHVVAMNVLYPTLVGARVHLNPLIVTFSLMFWGFLWDAPGLLLAIPLTAGLKAVCDNVAALRKYGRFLGD